MFVCALLDYIDNVDVYTRMHVVLPTLCATVFVLLLLFTDRDISWFYAWVGESGSVGRKVYHVTLLLVLLACDVLLILGLFLLAMVTLSVEVFPRVGLRVRTSLYPGIPLATRTIPFEHIVHVKLVDNVDRFLEVGSICGCGFAFWNTSLRARGWSVGWSQSGVLIGVVNRLNAEIAAMNRASVFLPDVPSHLSKLENDSRAATDAAVAVAADTDDGSSQSENWKRESIRRLPRSSGADVSSIWLSSSDPEILMKHIRVAMVGQ